MKNFPPGTGFGAIFVVVGIGMMVMMATDQSGLHVPLWVAEAAASCFALAGASIIAQAYGKLRLARAFSLGVIYGLAVPGLWIAFGSDGSGCTASGSFGPVSFEGMASGLSCRIVFGAGAVIVLACAVAVTYGIMRGVGFQPKAPGAQPIETKD